MIRYALNYCLVRIAKRFQDQQGNIKIDPSWHPEQYATMEGIVYSTPLSVENNLQRRVVTKVNDGDRVFFSYTVVFGYDLQPDGQTPIYRNLVIQNGEEYWKVDVGDMFFKIVDDRIEMITEHVLMGIVEHSEKNVIRSLVIKNKIPQNRGIVKAIPPNKNLSVHVGDMVCFEPRFVQKYNILGQEHMIIQTHRLLAKA